MAFLSPKTLTRVRRNNLARYISGSYGRGNGWRIASGPGRGAGYRGRLTPINHGYAEVTGNMGKFWFTPVVFVMPDNGSV
jgi:hypothetical protein